MALENCAVLLLSLSLLLPVLLPLFEHGPARSVDHRLAETVFPDVSAGPKDHRPETLGPHCYNALLPMCARCAVFQCVCVLA